jgi:hypothetical protein
MRAEQLIQDLICIHVRPSDLEVSEVKFMRQVLASTMQELN